jgi:Tfp pilus assembly protein PilV
LPKRGFSLLEVLLGGILFASLVVFFAGIWGLHARTVGHSRARIIATFIAAQQLEN